DAGGECRDARWRNKQRVRAALICRAGVFADVAVEPIVLASVGRAWYEAHVVLPHIVNVGAAASVAAKKVGNKRDGARLRVFAPRVVGGSSWNAIRDVVDKHVIVTIVDVDLRPTTGVVERVDLVVEGGIIRNRYV